MKFDEALVKYVGSMGRYQALMAVLLCCVAFPTCMSSMVIMFTAGMQEHWCNINQPTSGPLANFTEEEWLEFIVPVQQGDSTPQRDSCKMYNISALLRSNSSDWERFDNMQLTLLDNITSMEECNTWHYDQSQYTSTIISQWDLVCEKSYLVSLTKSIGMAGLVFGGAIGGIAGDRFGRKKSIVATLVMAAVLNVALTFSPNLPVYMSITFFIFAIGTISYLSAFTCVIELLGPKRRAQIGGVMLGLDGVAYMLLAGVAYAIRDWRSLVWAITPSCLIVSLPMICLLTESPRWLYAKKKDEEGLKALNFLAIRNGKPKFKVEIQLEENKETGQLKEFFSSPTLVFRSCLLFYAWFVAACTYYGLTFNLESLAGSIYVNLLISGILEVIGCSAGQVLSQTRLGRRLSTCLFYVLAGVSLLLILAIPSDKKVVSTVLATFGRFCCTAFYTVIYIWTAELYPTIVRNTGISLSSGVGKVGAVCAPFINYLVIVASWLPAVVFGVMSLLAGLLLFILPETRGIVLPQTIHEIKTMARNEKHLKAIEKRETKSLLSKSSAEK